jgi:RNA polymerase sigma-70 factor (ECF subfamily)
MTDPHTEPSITRSQGEPSSYALTETPVVSDELLLHGVRMRDAEALEKLFDRYGGLVFTLGLRMVGDRHVAEDVMQDVFLRCWNGLDQFDGTRGTVTDWLFGLTRRRAKDVQRGRQQQASVHERETVTAPVAAEATPPDRADDAATRAMVSQALNELPEPQRAAIELAFYSGLTQTEVAARLGEPVGTVKTRIRDGLRRLRRMLASLTERAPTREHGAP